MSFNENIETILDIYFNQGGNIKSCHQLVKHQIGSYNDFIENKLEKILEGYNPIVVKNEYDDNIKDYKQKIYLYMEDPHFTKPIYKKQDGTQINMTPNMARYDNLTYSADLYINIRIITECYNNDNTLETTNKKLNDIYIGKLPVMVGSKACILSIIPDEHINNECKYDMGGYFIVNGNEKVLISQDRIKENYVLIFKPSNNNENIHAEIRSTNDALYLPAKTISLTMNTKSNHMGRVIRINTSFLKYEIPVFIMFRALGILNDFDIISHIIYDINNKNNKDILQQLKACCDDASGVYTREDAIDCILRNITGNSKNIKTYNIVENILKNDFLPNISNFNKKALYLGYMIKKILNIYLGYDNYDNRDSYMNKRIDSPGILMSSLFRQSYGRITKELKLMIERDIGLWRANNNKVFDLINDRTHISKYFKQSLLDSWLKYALSTGNWGIKSIGSFQNIKQGVSQVLNRMSYLSTLSHLRRINTAMEKNGKLVQPRKLDISQFGMICPCETPEGAPVGLVKNLSMSTNISSYGCNLFIKELLIKNNVIEYTQDITNHSQYLKNFANYYNCFIIINGEIFGYHTNPVQLFNILKQYKRQSIISPITSISLNLFTRILQISTEAGRMYRPLFIVDQNNELRFNKFIKKYGLNEIKNWTFEMCISPYTGNKEELEGFIEYLDIDEITHSMIAMYPSDLLEKSNSNKLIPNYTYCEIHPSLMFGVLGANIAFANHNQAPRNTYQSAMGKQALGIYMSNFNDRMDTISNILNYPQKSLITTKLSKYTNTSELPAGINAIVAIMTYSGFNQEDGIIVNKDAVDRGLFVSTHYKTLKEQCNKNQSTGEEEYFCLPDENERNKQYNYSKLNKYGFVPKNTYVENNDIIVGKIMPKKIKGKIYNIDSSISIKPNEKGIVDLNYNEINNEGYNFCKIRIRNHRIPAVGDKLASSIAQKASIGMIYNQEDMPYTKDGIVPDLIMNPHAIPSRMTIAQLMECVLGKVACFQGKIQDSTPYNQCTVEEICNKLESYGMQRYSNEILYDGYTGKQIKTEIFIGPTYYQRLKHMVVDKIHSRGSNGPIVLLTRQPSEGRSRSGGLRLGEMERDAILAHGTSLFLKERLLECSDNSKQIICKTCGMIIIANSDKKLYTCSYCRNETSPSQIRIPYSMKLLLQELQSMSIAVRICI
jgi:DNA-directed RNA polymerase II subunit RPB2